MLKMCIIFGLCLRLAFVAEEVLAMPSSTYLSEDSAIYKVKHRTQKIPKSLTGINSVLRGLMKASTLLTRPFTLG